MDKHREIIKNLLDEANTALLQGQHPLAVTIADGILAQKQDYPQGYSIKFKALVLGKEYKLAREIGPKAAELNPTSEYILNNLACLDLDAGSPDTAITLLQSLLDQYGDRPSWLYNLGLAHRSMAQTRLAIEVFGRVLDCDPGHDRATFQLVQCLQEDGQLDQAVSTQNYLRLLRSSHPSTHSQFICLAAMTGELTAVQLKQEARLWNKRFIPQGRSYATRALNPDDKLTIGFLLGDLPSSWLSHIIAPLVDKFMEENPDLLK